MMLMSHRLAAAVFGNDFCKILPTSSRFDGTLLTGRWLITLCIVLIMVLRGRLLVACVPPLARGPLGTGDWSQVLGKYRRIDCAEMTGLLSLFPWPELWENEG